MALHGAALRHACGWCARMTPSGEAPPAQGGKQILGTARASTIQEQIVDKAVDVPVNMQLKFQQFCEFDILVPQIQFIVRVPDISVCHRDRYAQCQTVQGTVKTSQVQFLGEVGRARCCARGGASVAVYRRGRCPVWLFTAVNIQRHVPAVLGEHPVQKTKNFPQVQFLADVR